MHLHEDDRFFAEAAAKFLGTGLGAGEAVVLLATEPHRVDVEHRLRTQGVDLDLARSRGRYVALDAQQAFTAVMVDGQLDESRFARVIGDAIRRTQDGPTWRVRAWGELVGLLWASGARDDALRLEALWSDLTRELPLSVLCSYPLAAFAGESDRAPFLRICQEHSAVVPAESYPGDAAEGERLRAIAMLQQKATAAEAHPVDRLQAQMARAQLAAIIESSDDAIVGKNLDGIVTSWNRGAERLFGYTAEEMVGQPISRIIPPDSRNDLPTILAAIRRGERVDHFETERVRKDGQPLHVSLTISPIRGPEGKIIGASKIARDVTERRRADAALRESHDVLALLNRTSRVLSAELELQNLAQTVTDAATELTGAKFGAFFYNVENEREESYMLYALSGAPREAFADFPLPRNTKIFAPTFRGDGVVRIDDVTQDARYGQNAPYRGTPPGHLPVTSYLAVPVVFRGEVLGGLFFGHPEPGRFSERDERVIVGLAAQAAIAIGNARLYAAERKARADAEAATRAKDDFLATVSHELRTPLSPILMWARMLKTGRLDHDRTARALDTIDRCAMAQAQLIDDLLDVSRIVAGTFRIELRQIRLPAVLEEAVEVVRPVAEANGVRLDVVVDPHAAPVAGDAERLQQVVWNLLSNAVKFTPSGGRVTLTLEQLAGNLRITVRDTGKGISAEFLPRVFDRFQQADMTKARTKAGLGVGLAIVRHVVERHGGAVRADSAGEGRGATFTVTLPTFRSYAADDLPVGAPASSPARQQFDSLAGVRVLVVEDDPASREAVRELLLSCGAEVELATAADEARAVLRRWKPELIVSDIGLPGEDGYAFITALRTDVAMATVPAVALTAYAGRDDKLRLLAAGFQAHIAKPFDPADLVSTVAALARGRVGP